MIHQLRNTGLFLPASEVEMIFFDKGGTLSKPVGGREDGGIPNFRKIMELIGADEDPAVFPLQRGSGTSNGSFAGNQGTSQSGISPGGHKQYRQHGSGPGEINFLVPEGVSIISELERN